MPPVALRISVVSRSNAGPQKNNVTEIGAGSLLANDHNFSRLNGRIYSFTKRSRVARSPAGEPGQAIPPARARRPGPGSSAPRVHPAQIFLCAPGGVTGSTGLFEKDMTKRLAKDTNKHTDKSKPSASTSTKTRASFGCGWRWGPFQQAFWRPPPATTWWL